MSHSSFEVISLIWFGIDVLYGLLTLFGLIVCLVFRRVSGWTGLMAIGFGLNIVAVVLRRIEPLLLRLQSDTEDRLFEMLNVGGGLFDVLGTALVVFGFLAVLIDCRGKLARGTFGGPRPDETRDAGRSPTERADGGRWRHPGSEDVQS
jgi:hypothetical protein